MGYSAESALRDLANPERQLLLRELETTPSLSVDELTDRLRAQLEETSRKNLQIRLYHAHLPRLDDHGIIQWEQAAGQVRQGTAFDEILPLLEAGMDDDGIKATGNREKYEL